MKFYAGVRSNYSAFITEESTSLWATAPGIRVLGGSQVKQLTTNFTVEEHKQSTWHIKEDFINGGIKIAKEGADKSGGLIKNAIKGRSRPPGEDSSLD